ncbi:2' O-ribose methyltransferase Mrm2 [Schizosaccharomyces japonicus yFS275]|uniref:rRNA methyltransferase 2, mitochondrial n=1 Tax=Schizosaccharomyces japonicus (strain yFS275 / FY16936) TaxID=402676 RepID=B6K506_SCHJY|nr:2' O-ribose methyltransferase Mrm2 [Schizosaccharomyces japonicus yFS275]EEB08610.2 2' O-ribose methyltransferase Mrm2 [Schizosaccharomyces japonicus yFS275]
MKATHVLSRTWAKARASDCFSKLSKKNNYRSRAAYKLIDLNRKHHIFNEGDTVIDLGFAPGSWSQVALKAVGPYGMVIGVDVRFVNPPQGVHAIIGDVKNNVTVNGVYQLLKKHYGNTQNNQCDVVISDMFHNATGIPFRDHTISISLCRAALEFSEHVLRSKGILICKYYKGIEENRFFKELQSHFREVIRAKPKASRKESKENYFVCLDKQKM